VLFLLALPFILYLSLKKKYRESLPARFFLFKNPPFKNKNSIWFHVCSLGEARALKPLIDRLSGKSIAITTITQTGQTQARSYSAEVRYLPYEMFLPFWVKRVEVLVVLEAEFWYLLFGIAKARGAKVMLLNARISDKSLGKYMRFAWFYKKLLAFVEIVYVQSESDKNRFLALGAKNIEVIGNIKLAGKITKTEEYAKPKRELIVAGSTHDGEEKSVLEAFVKYKKENDSMLVVVPRHPERFESVWREMQEYAQKYSLSISRFSQEKTLRSDLMLCDVMGELNNIYAISDIAILGGAFREDVGGHNPLEPAYFGCKIITGKHFFNQKELFKYVHHVQYVQSDEIEEALYEAKELPPSMVEEIIDLTPVVKKIEEIITEVA